MPPTGPSAAHARLLDQQAFLRRLARSLVADPHRAEDLAQDAALIALERPPTREDSMRAWLARVVRNRAVNVGLSEKRRRARELAVGSASTPHTPAEIEARFKVQLRVIAAVDRLAKPYRTTILLRYYHDLGPSAIARELGVPVPTVKSRLARALARLRRDLDDTEPEGEHGWAVVLAGGMGEAPRPMVATALAAGGIVMGAKLALGAAVVGCAVVLGGWWLQRPGTDQQARAGPGEAPPVIRDPVTGAGSEVVPGEEQTAIASAEPAAARTQVSAVPIDWSLALELRGWSEEDEGPFTLEVSRSEAAGPALSMSHDPVRELTLDLGELFAGVATRPDRLVVRIDHPAYLPAEGGVLVPQELLHPEAGSGELQTTIDLVRAKGSVIGTVEVPVGRPTDRVRVAIFALEGETPERNPVEVVRPDASGRFRLRADSAERHAIIAFMERDHVDLAPALRPETRLVAVPDASVLEIDALILGKGECIEGHVTSPGGTPPPSGQVRVELLDRAGVYFQGLAWMGERFEIQRVECSWDEDGHLLVTGLASQRYGLTMAPARRASPIPRLSLGGTPVEIELTPPAYDVSLALDVVRVTFQVLGQGEPVAGATATARWRPGTGGRARTSERADSLGRFEVQLDPAEGLDLEIADARWPPKRVTFTPEELTSDRVVVIHLDGEAREPATLAIRFEGDRSALAPAVVAVLLYDRERVSDWELEHHSSRWGMTRAMGFAARAELLPSGPIPEWTEEAGLWVVSGIPPGRYTVRIDPRTTQEGAPCFLLGEDFEVELHVGERVEHTWQAQLGGKLRVDLTALDNLGFAHLLDDDGNKVWVSFGREGPVPGSWGGSSGMSRPGLYDVRPMLAAGFYGLGVRLENGSKRTIPVIVEGGRVTDVVVGPDGF